MKRLLHFEILGRLGEGFVYRAQDTRSGDQVAIKVLPAFMLSDTGLHARFEREVEAERSIEHPNLARFHEVGETIVDDPELVGSVGDADGKARVLYLVREYVEGANLEALVGSSQLPLKEAIQTALQIAKALECVHRHGVVHRNINPDNIRITPSGLVKLLDFGLVKFLEEEAFSREQRFKTSAGQLLGTAPYLAPEQVKGDEVDARTDLFALGVVLYLMLTGETPFPHTNLLKYFHAIREENPRPVSELREDVPPVLEQTLVRLLAKDPNDRYQSATELIGDLQNLLDA